MPWQFTILLLWYWLWHQTPMGSLLLSCVWVPITASLSPVPPASGVQRWGVGSAAGYFSAFPYGYLRVCPLARSLHSCLRFHRTVVPMDDIHCGLRLFLSSCRNPLGRWELLHVAYPTFPGCAHHWITWHSVLVACHSLIHHHLSLRYGVCGSMPVLLHFALSPMQFPVVVQVHWTPSAFLPYGSALACAVPVVFYTPVSGIESWLISAVAGGLDPSSC